MKHFLHYWQNKQTHQRVWALAWPMILSNIANPLLGLVDTAVMGHLDSSVFMGAVALGSMIIGFAIWGCNFLRMGTTGFASQAYGQEDYPRMYAILWRSIMLAMLIAFSLIILQNYYLKAAFYFIDGTEQVEALASSYFDIRIYGLPAAISTFAIVGWFIGLHNTRVPLLLLVITNSLNIILDILLVIGFDMEVRGAAYATLISEYAGLLLGLYFVLRKMAKRPTPLARKTLLNIHAWLEMFSVNRDIFIRTIALEVVFFIIAAEGARLGNDILAANTVLLNFLFLIANGLDGLAQALEALVGRAIGARDTEQFKGAIVVSSIWSLIMSIAYFIFFYFVGDWFIALLTDIESVRATAATYLPWLIILPLVGVWSYLLDGIFIGATRAKEMRDSMLIATVIGFIPTWYYFSYLENHGVWLAFHVFMVTRALVLGWYFKKLYRAKVFVPVS